MFQIWFSHFSLSKKIMSCQVGHKNLTSLLPCLEGMSWKTAPAKHLEAFVAFQCLLFSLFRVCSNGLIPDLMLKQVPAFSFQNIVSCFQFCCHIFPSTATHRRLFKRCTARSRFGLEVKASTLLSTMCSSRSAKWQPRSET